MILNAILWAACLLLAAQLLFALVNGRSLSRPGRRARKVEGRPLVSVLIPARDEERNIEDCLRHVLASDDAEFRLEVIVYDDDSGDDTGGIVRRVAVEDSRVGLMRGGEPPRGWKGKCYACHRLAEQASGSWYLMLDADVKLGPLAIRDTLRSIVKKKAGLLTGFPKQNTGTWLERLVVPMMEFVVLCHLPIPVVSRSQSGAFVAAHGAYMLFKRSAYESAGGYEAAKDEMVDDMAMARAVKKAGYRMVLSDMSRHAHMRMYHGAREVWNGFGKNMFTGLGGNYLLLAALLLWYGVLYVLPPVTLLIGAFTGDLHLMLVSGGAMLLGMAVKAVCDAYSGLPAWNGVWVWATICCTIAIALSSAAGGIGGKGHEWKGRRYG
ncbi:glycosyltransferase family 2 protein [Saccharibacillus sp. CPCC 101409]|uniref:glycosyltransferase n=1 Tax=Saccharibacillus sp. CPCC 101409 TaxID=3058041 RepID=UPI0026729756|nr:glycosyltransferase family 2 protein [Saccharibacillus sp. CPCC 101409]MDO3412138.1 glycosyltransferase family 2 protein [Saccharibacillus sp. CPCC 101409]